MSASLIGGYNYGVHPMKQEEDKDEQDTWRGSASISNVGIELAVAVFIGAFLGYQGDRYFHTKPWLMVFGLFLGTAAGFYRIYRQYVEGRFDD